MSAQLPILIELLLSALILFGSALVLIGSIGLVKLPDFFTRLHAPTKATTLGMGSLLIASLIFTSYVTGDLHVQQLLITLFLFITAPIAAHMLAKTALHLRIPILERTANAGLQHQARERQAPVTDTGSEQKDAE